MRNADWNGRRPLLGADRRTPGSTARWASLPRSHPGTATKRLLPRRADSSSGRFYTSYTYRLYRPSSASQPACTDGIMITCRCP